MNLEKRQLAKNLFFQTDLTKSQIAAMLGISRRSVTYWIREGDWIRLKSSAQHLPSLLAEKCYHMIGHLTEIYLSERRINNPISNKEIDGLYKLTLMIGKLKNRSTLNESMEMFGFFLDGVRAKNPDLALKLTPHIEDYVASRAAIYTRDVMPERFTGIGGRIPEIEEDKTEEQLDNRENFFSDPDIVKVYAEMGIPFPSDEEICTLPQSGPQETEEERKDRQNKEAQAIKQSYEDRHSEESAATQKHIPSEDAQQQETNMQDTGNATGISELRRLYWQEFQDSLLPYYPEPKQQSDNDQGSHEGSDNVL